MQDIQQATAEFETWLGTHVKLQPAELKIKHARMADKNDVFPFFRATYYRWAQHWKQSAGDLAGGPRVPSVGDLHLENYGTWRDAEGRLVWGVNDLDEADKLPWAHDLVRLASSVDIARPAFLTTVKLSDACREILAGYRENLGAGGRPYVLEEHFPELRALAFNADRKPAKFWKKLKKDLQKPKVAPPKSALSALLRGLPKTEKPPEVFVRPGVGLGSLGRPRFVALVEWCGSKIAREAKSAAPAATKWLRGAADDATFAARLAAKSKRCPDPFYRPDRPWITRRLGPRVSRIDLGQLDGAADFPALFTAMGGEIANLHLADAKAGQAILAALEKCPKGWLEAAAREFAKRITVDQREWRAGRRK